MRKKQLNLSAIDTLIIDEADRMLDMGFSDDVKIIAAALPKKRQTLLFTATMDKRLMPLANTILHQPERIEVLGKKITLESIEQRLHIADDYEHKTKLLHHVLTNESVHKAIIFSATKRGTADLAEKLYRLGHNVGTLHGDMKQSQRNRTLTNLRLGKIYLLVATDVAARGIDVDDISHVVNFDLPKVPEDYIHRIGRTGRAGKSGIAISLANSHDRQLLKRIEQFTKHTMAHQTIPGLEPKRGGLHQNQPNANKQHRSRTKKASQGSQGSPGKKTQRAASYNTYNNGTHGHGNGTSRKGAPHARHARKGKQQEKRKYY